MPLISPNRLRVNDSYTFLMKELEKIDEKIQEPLAGTTWPRDIPVITGGGLTESIASIDVSYASTGKGEDNLILTDTNEIPVMQADLNKNTARCFNFAEYVSFSTIEREKMLQVGRDPETFLNKGVRLHCDKILDTNVYTGFTKVSSTGLINSPNITRVSAQPHTSGGTDTKWSQKTADEILADINTLISQIWYACDCAPDALPNHILVPVDQFGQLVSRKVSDDSQKSILTYVLENNLTTRQGGNLVISPCKQCFMAGSSMTDRMVGYINHPDRVCFNLTQPLRRMETEYANLRIQIPYIAQFSEVRFLYPQTVLYMDGI